MKPSYIALLGLGLSGCVPEFADTNPFVQDYRDGVDVQLPNWDLPSAQPYKYIAGREHIVKKDGDEGFDDVARIVTANARVSGLTGVYYFGHAS